MKFYGTTIGTEKADDLLFALQAWFGRPHFGYADFLKMNLSADQVSKARQWVRDNALSKHNHFQSH